MTGYVFDIDDTLYCREDLLWKAVNEATGNALSDRDRNGFIRLFYQLSEENLPLVERGEITAQESNIWRFVECFRSFGVSDPEAVGVTATDLYTDLQNHITLSEPLVRLMDHLSSSGCPLGVLTNGETSHQWAKYDMLRIRGSGHYQAGSCYLPDRTATDGTGSGRSVDDRRLLRGGHSRSQPLRLALCMDQPEK